MDCTRPGHGHPRHARLCACLERYEPAARAPARRRYEVWAVIPRTGRAMRRQLARAA